MLYLVGLGLEQSISLSALRSLRECDQIYLENYTSPSLDREKIIEDLAGIPVEYVKREFVEDGKKILEQAMSSKIALVCPGDPLVATTHQDLRVRALRRGIETRVVHGSSILSAVGGELGLHAYNFGRMVTMTREPLQYTAYNTIFRNLLQSLHTIVLLEWDESGTFFLEPALAVRSLLDAEKDLHYGMFNENTLILVASRLGSKSPLLNAMRFGEMSYRELGEPPHTMVIPGRLHFTESETLSTLFNRPPESFIDNSRGLTELAHIMITKYSEKTLNALNRAKMAASQKGAKYSDVFENVECYTQDAKRFLNEGKKELAVLSIGYAEGLLDSLRFSGQLEFEW